MKLIFQVLMKVSMNRLIPATLEVWNKNMDNLTEFPAPYSELHSTT